LFARHYEDGFLIADSQRDLIPIQSRVYAMAKDYHMDDPETDTSSAHPNAGRSTLGV